MYIYIYVSMQTHTHTHTLGILVRTELRNPGLARGEVLRLVDQNRLQLSTALQDSALGKARRARRDFRDLGGCRARVVSGSCHEQKPNARHFLLLLFLIATNVANVLVQKQLMF